MFPSLLLPIKFRLQIWLSIFRGSILLVRDPSQCRQEKSWNHPTTVRATIHTWIACWSPNSFSSYFRMGIESCASLDSCRMWESWRRRKPECCSNVEHASDPAGFYTPEDPFAMDRRNLHEEDGTECPSKLRRLDKIPWQCWDVRMVQRPSRRLPKWEWYLASGNYRADLEDITPQQNLARDHDVLPFSLRECFDSKPSILTKIVKLNYLKECKYSYLQ